MTKSLNALMKVVIISTISCSTLSAIIALSPDYTDDVILKNDVLLEKGAKSYMQVRHIVLKGANEDIGEALGKIAKDDYNIKQLLPTPKTPPDYMQKRIDFLSKIYPYLLDRMEGVAKAYDFTLDATSGKDPSFLLYCINNMGCSAVLFPKVTIKDGDEEQHCMLARNYDWILPPSDSNISLP